MGLLAGYEPPLAITASLAVAFALLAFTDLAAGVALYVFASFFALHSFGMHDMLARAVLGLAWIALLATQSRGELNFFKGHPWLTAAFGLFVGWAALSMAWAESPAKAFESVQWYFLNVIYFLIVFTAVRSRDDLAKILFGFVLGAVAVAAVGLVSPTATDQGAAGERLGTELLDPNILAAVLVSATALSFGLFALNRSPGMRLLPLGTALFAFAGILLTGSRGGLVALLVVIVVGILLSGRLRPLVTAVSLVAVCATYLFFAGFASEQLRDRLTQPTTGEERIQEGRTTIWQVAWRAFEDKPVAGLGAGNFRVSSRHYLQDPGALPRTDEILRDNPQVVHNAHLEVLTELGVVGSALFVFILLSCVASAIVAARRFERIGDRQMQLVSLSVGLGLLGVIVANFFFSDEYGKWLWVLMALGPAVLNLATRSEASGSPSDADYTR